MSKKHSELDSIITAAAIQENKEVPAVGEETASQTVNPGDSAEQERLSQLEKELQLAQQTKDEYYNRMLRIQADFDNFRRRSRQEFEQLNLCAGEDLLKKILPVLDSLERAINCFKEATDNCSWQEGVDLTLRQFQGILTNEGLESIPALNEAFDPLVHEAVFQETKEGILTPVIIEEMQKGYKFKGRLIRPALVKVAVPE